MQSWYQGHRVKRDLNISCQQHHKLLTHCCFCRARHGGRLLGRGSRPAPGRPDHSRGSGGGHPVSSLRPPLPQVLMRSYGSNVVFVGRRCACPKLNPAGWPWVERADLWHAMPKSIRCGDVKINDADFRLSKYTILSCIVLHQVAGGVGRGGLAAHIQAIGCAQILKLSSFGSSTCNCIMFCQVAGGAGRGGAAGQLQAARLAFRAAALLGRALPHRLPGGLRCAIWSTYSKVLLFA